MPLSGSVSPGLEILEDHPGIARGDVEVLDGVGDRRDGLEEAPEGAEQTEEDEQADEVARHVAILVEAHLDRIEDRAHRLRRDRHAADAVAEQRRHRREQHRRPLDLDAWLRHAEGVDPPNLGEQAQHLADGEHDADQEHRDDDAVEPGIGEGRPRRPGDRG
jgi:hypothetical protein